MQDKKGGDTNSLPCIRGFVFGYEVVCSALKGLDDAKSSLYFVSIAVVIHIVLDNCTGWAIGNGDKWSCFIWRAESEKEAIKA